MHHDITPDLHLLAHHDWSHAIQHVIVTYKHKHTQGRCQEAAPARSQASRAAVGGELDPSNPQRLMVQAHLKVVKSTGMERLWNGP